MIDEVQEEVRQLNITISERRAKCMQYIDKNLFLNPLSTGNCSFRRLLRLPYNCSLSTNAS